MQNASFLFSKCDIIKYMHHIFIGENEIDLSNKVIEIDSSGENYNHLVKSLRVEKGENVLCSVDGFVHPFDYRTIVKDVNAEKITLSIEENLDINELPIKINLYQGITKFDKLEFIIEKAVELGVYSICPVATEYCVAKIEDKKADKKLDRFNKISKSAAEQSKRHIIPKVLDPISFKQMIEDMKSLKCSGDASKTYNLLFYENAAGIVETREKIARIKENIVDNIEVNVIIGPEGGFSEKEISLARENGLDILSLGDRILRTETAAITALSILMYEFNAV